MSKNFCSIELFRKWKLNDNTVNLGVFSEFFNFKFSFFLRNAFRKPYRIRFNKRLFSSFNFIIYVNSGFFTRLFRAKKRDGLSYKQILLRFKAQKNLLKEYQKFNKEIIVVKNNNKADKEKFMETLKELNLAIDL